MTTRRGFLTGILALGAAPAIVRAESLMRLWVPPQELVTLDMLRQVKAELLANVGHPADKFIFVDYGPYDMTTILEAEMLGDHRIVIRSIRHG